MACIVQVEGMSLVIDDLVGSTGLELKVDPGVPYVYAGFAGMLKHRHPLLSSSFWPNSAVHLLYNPAALPLSCS